MARSAKSDAPSIGDQFQAMFEERQREGLKCLSIISGLGASNADDSDASRISNAPVPATPSSTSNALAKDRALTAVVRASWADAFLTSLARHGTILAATRLAGVARQTVYDLIEESPTFARAVEVAKAEFAELLELVAIERAMNGSERLLEFLLRGALPNKYRESQTAVQVVSGPIQVDVVADALNALAPSPVHASISAIE